MVLGHKVKVALICVFFKTPLSAAQAFGIQYILIVGSECQSYFPGCFDYMYFDVFDTPEETRIKDCFEPAYQFIGVACAQSL